MEKTIKERARELWENLPIIQEKYISTIEDALKEQKAIGDKRYEEFLAYMTNQMSLSLATQRKYIIVKACEWLRENRKSDLIDDSGCDFGRSAELSDSFIEEFKKAMEE